MGLRGPVLVGTDLTSDAVPAVREGHALARRLHSPLLVCHVLPEVLRTRMLFPQYGAVDPTFADVVGRRAREELEHQLAAVLGEHRRHTHVAIDSGPPHRALLAQADAADAGVIVVGAGNVARRLVQHGSRPVLVSRGRGRGVVIATTDFSEPSVSALMIAADEAQRRGARLHALHVFDAGASAYASAAVAGLPYVPITHTPTLHELDQLRLDGQAELDSLCRRLAVSAETIALTGTVVASIVKHASAVGAELIVVATRGRTGLARLALGSTAKNLMEDAPCSVLVVGSRT